MEEGRQFGLEKDCDSSEMAVTDGVCLGTRRGCPGVLHRALLPPLHGWIPG